MKQENKICGGLYTKKVMETFKNPHNFGRMKNPDGVGKVGNPVCGDVMHLYIKVASARRSPRGVGGQKGGPASAKGSGEARNEIIKDIKFETFGCVAAISTSSMITDLVKGKTIKEAMKINKDSIVKSLGGLPKIKYHCSVLAIDALHKAIEDYRRKVGD